MSSRYTREIHTRQPGGAALDTRRASLRRRFQLQRVAQSILFRAGLEPKRQHRTVWCHRHVVTEAGIPVHRKHSGAGARLGRIKTCGSVWACPVCASKVAEVRRRELAAAMVKHTDAGGHAYLLTFTFPHYKGQPLPELLEPFTKARQSFQNCRAWRAVCERAEKLGVVNSLEVTYGAANGWHPHLHMLMFCRPGAFGEGQPDESGRLASAAIDYLRAEWARLLEKRGLVDAANRQWALQYGLDVRGGQGAAEYIAKWGHDQAWGLSAELTSSHAKMGGRDAWGSGKHFTPFELLAMARAGDGHAICAFREFVAAFDGRRMLTWSRGLKAHFAIEDIDDEEAAHQEELALPDEHQVGELQAEQLATLTKFGRLGDFLAWVAEFCATENAQAQIDAWIDDIARAGGRAASGAVLVDRMIVGPNSYWFAAELIE